MLPCTFFLDQYSYIHKQTLATQAGTTMQVTIDGISQTINIADGGSEELILSHEDLIPLAMLLLAAWQGCTGDGVALVSDCSLLGSVGDLQQI